MVFLSPLLFLHNFDEAANSQHLPTAAGKQYNHYNDINHITNDCKDLINYDAKLLGIIIHTLNFLFTDILLYRVETMLRFACVLILCLTAAVARHGAGKDVPVSYLVIFLFIVL